MHLTAHLRVVSGAERVEDERVSVGHARRLLNLLLSGSLLASRNVLGDRP